MTEGRWLKEEREVGEERRERKRRKERSMLHVNIFNVICEQNVGRLHFEVQLLVFCTLTTFQGKYFTKSMVLTGGFTPYITSDFKVDVRRFFTVTFLPRH